MTDFETGAIAMEPLRWWRWLLGVVVVCVVIPLLLTLVYYVAVAGFTLRNEFAMATPFIFAAIAFATAPLNIFFALGYWRFRKLQERRVIVTTSAVLWGLVGAAFTVFGAPPGAVVLTFPLAALVGAAASYLFILIADGVKSRNETADVA